MRTAAKPRPTRRREWLRRPHRTWRRAAPRGTRVQSRITLHAPEHTSLTVGDHAPTGDGNAIRGPLVVGDNVVSEDGRVVFQITVEDNVTVRTGAAVAGGFVLRKGAIVPEGAVVSTQADADALLRW